MTLLVHEEMASGTSETDAIKTVWERQHRADREREERFALAHREAIDELRAKLLAIGGTRVSKQFEPHVAGFAKHGVLLPPHKMKLRLGAPCHCHENSAYLWLNRRPKSRLFLICSGYALSDDGVWRSHSWLIERTKSRPEGEKNVIIETTAFRDKYFGCGWRGEIADRYARSMLGQDDHSEVASWEAAA